MMDSKLILDFNKLPEFQKLNAYYMQSTVFSVLGIQRSENRHSSFLAWLLNPDASHSLKEMPLRKFLALIAAKADDQDKCYFYQVRQHLLSGNYRLQVDRVKTEQSIVGLANEKLSDLDGIVEKADNGQFKKDGQNRFDIWMLVHITFTDEQDRERNWTVPIIGENKIYRKRFSVYIKCFFICTRNNAYKIFLLFFNFKSGFFISADSFIFIFAL